MSIKSEMQCIGLELASIAESQDRIKAYALELNKLNPLSVGQELVVNGWSHAGKTLVSERVYVSDSQGNDVSVTAKEPVNFTAVGKVKRKDGSLGSYDGFHSIKIAKLVD
ncbi:hypothetical protein F0267_25885 [Vibrio coralliilyticus]|uniref:hypothetical protein n=1 Tax=Vibrio TaxID=662 RepID=UPI00148D9D2B|nr:MULTISPECIES: hypothetical protein [Vibrio]NOH26200.1 hypothetical protein [Vibrio europaeus]NOH41660.1 hypothetical protein [Vibrio coralliilyticus]